MNINEGMLVLDCHNVQPRARTPAHIQAMVSNLLGQSGTEGILLLLLLMEGRGLLRACSRGLVLQDLMHFCRKTQQRGGRGE